MRIEAHDKFDRVIKSEVTRLVVYDDFNNPVACAFKHSQGWMYVGHLRDKEFFDYLKAMGVDSTYIVDAIDPHKLKSI